MKEKYDITDAELEVIQVLWKKGKCKLSEIIAELSKEKERNKNTIKTLLYRLVDKGMVKSIKLSSQEFYYDVTISEKKYLKQENSSFLSKLYNGNVNNMLLNFVEDKKISKAELQKLIDILESEE